MTDTNDTNDEGTYNPSGDVPSHPADPKYGDKDEDDTYDESDTPDDTETE